MPIVTGGFRAFWLLINIYHIIFGVLFIHYFILIYVDARCISHTQNECVGYHTLTIFFVCTRTSGGIGDCHSVKTRRHTVAVPNSPRGLTLLVTEDMLSHTLTFECMGQLGKFRIITETLWWCNAQTGTVSGVTRMYADISCIRARRSCHAFHY